MIIECPACTSRYRIREDKLPDAGGNIKCPNCAHVFFVAREGISGMNPAATAEAAGPRIHDSNSTSGPRPVAAAPAAATPAATVDEGPKRWKLRNAVGLIYDFQSTEQLRTWLGTRESHDGMQVSSNGGSSWTPLPEAPELSDVPVAGPKVGQPRQQPRSAGPTKDAAAKMREEAQARLAAKRRQVDSDSDSGSFNFHAIKPPPTQQQQQTTRIITGLALVILPLVAAVALHTSGVIDLGNLGSIFSSNNDIPQYIPPPERENDREIPRQELTTEEAVNRLMTLAAAAQSRNEPTAAIEHLEQAASLIPQDDELHCLLVPLYTAEGRADDAAASERRCAGEGSGEEPAEGSAAAPPAGSGDTPDAAEGIPTEGSGSAP